MRRRARGKSSQHIFHVFNWIDREALASLDQTHYRCSSFSAFFGAGEEPVAPAENHWLYASLASIVADFNERMIDVNQKCVPAIERVRDCFTEFCLRGLEVLSLIKPSLEQIEFRFCKTRAQVLAIVVGQRLGDALNVEEAFDHTHRKFSSIRIICPGLFEFAVYMRPAVGRRGTAFDDIVKFVCAVRLQNSFEPGKSSIGIFGMLGVGVVVENVWIVDVAAVDPDECFVCFSKPFFNYRKGGGIGLNYEAVEDALLHSSYDRLRDFCNSSQPSAHGGAVDGKAKCSEHLFLSVQGNMQPELVCGDFRQESRTGETLIDWLKRFLCGENLSVATLASVLVHDVPNVFVECSDEFKLMRNFKTDDFTLLTALRATEVGGFNMMLLVTSWESRAWAGPTATGFLVFNYIQPLLLGIEFVFSLVMNCFARAGEQRGIYFCRLLTEGGTISSAELFFEFCDSCKKFFDEIMAIADVIREICRVVFWWGGRMFFVFLYRDNYIIQ